MSINFDLRNKAALEFSRIKSREIKKIYQPLKKFGISNFTYGRFFNGGSRIYFSASLGWTEYYIKNNYQDVIEHMDHYIPPDGTRYAFWTTRKKNKIFAAASEVFNFCHGFTIYEKYDEHVDFFNFATEKDNDEVRNFLINHLQILESFVSDFKKRLNDLIEPDDKTKLLIPKKEIFFEKIKREPYIDYSRIKKFMEEIKYQPKLDS